MVEERKQAWISAYLFYTGSANKYLIECIQPFIKKMKYEKGLIRYFFIRYYEGGPHIRLRLLVKKEEESKWKKRLYSKHKAYNAEIKKCTKISEEYANFGIQFVEYIPEINRYGGIHVMNEAEKQFESGSEVVLHNLMQYSENWKDNTAFFLAIKMHLVFFVSMGFSIQEMMKTCKFFIWEWLPSLYDTTKPEKEQQQFFLSEFAKKFNLYKEQMILAVSAFLKEIQTNPSKDTGLNTYYLKNKKINKMYTDKNINLSIESSITTSFMHMTHNRIGIINTDEAYLVYLLYKCIENKDNIDE